jgi:hypothetical protein
MDTLAPHRWEHARRELLIQTGRTTEQEAQALWPEDDEEQEVTSK